MSPKRVHRERPEVEGTGPDDLLNFPSRRRLFVLPEQMTLYVSVPKNACTSLKWLFAELAGEDLVQLRKGELGFAPTRESQIHNRARWTPAASVLSLDDDVRTSISPDNGWFVFGVVRDPRLRLFSAWQDKYLLRSPGYYEFWDRPDGLTDPPPERSEDVIEAFHAFVAEVSADPEHPALQDGHFITQTSSLAEHLVDYTRIYDMSELGTLLVDLQAHLEQHGFTGQVSLGRSNSSPFTAVRELFADGTGEALEKMYAPDFERWGHFWDFSKVEQRSAADAWSKHDFDHAASMIAMSERLADVVRAARTLRYQNAKLHRRIDKLTGRTRDETPSDD